VLVLVRTWPVVLAGLVPGVGLLFAEYCEDRKVSEGVQGVSTIQYAYRVILCDA
jgi:hypothetical protein